MNKNKSSNRLLIAILIGIVFGIALGGAWPEAGIAVKVIGEIFIKALLMLVILLVMTSMVVGITRLGDVRKLGVIGSKTITYYLITTALSVIMGNVLVNLIQPGRAETEQKRIALRGEELAITN
ncbi:MAG TPA: cation:dicarboxylase symporter family transporter [Candidatus Marinimicrobia bacterium]|jgi:solute carrier family 1 (high affinity glutamate transporter) protein 1|nr:cation:dicarboxylase symporter family transporter [Candidatus Neomarinimicrobiota bacterium]